MSGNMNSLEMYRYFQEENMRQYLPERIRKEQFQRIVTEIIGECKNEIYPKFVESIKRKVYQGPIYLDEYMIICTAGQYLLNLQVPFAPTEVRLFDRQVGYSPKTSPHAHQHIFMIIDAIEKEYFGSGQGDKKVAGRKKVLADIEDKIKERNRELSQLNQDFAELQRRSRNLSNELEKEYALEKEKMRKQLALEQRSEIEGMKDGAKKALEQQVKIAINEEMSQVKNTAKYEVIRRENEELMDSMKGIREDRKDFVNHVCGEIRGVSASIHSQTNEMERQMEEMKALVEKEMSQYMNVLSGKMAEIYQTMNNDRANHINSMVNLQREIEGADYQALLDNYCMLQESLFYSSSEEELGMHPTKVGNFLKRYLRTLGSLGYELYEPVAGEEVNYALCEIVDDREQGGEIQQNPPQVPEPQILKETECIKEIVTSGFIKDGEVVKKPKVTTLKKYVIS